MVGLWSPKPVIEVRILADVPIKDQDEKMKNKNKYGFYSGGYIFDRIDRYALRCLNIAYPTSENEPWYTAHVDVSYLKQLCDLDSSVTFCRTTQFQYTPYVVSIGVEFVQGNTVIAHGLVQFAKAKNNYCKIKTSRKSGRPKGLKK